MTTPAAGSAAGPDKSHWKADDSVQGCEACQGEFTLLSRRHHCRACGGVFCDDCSFYRAVCEKSNGAVERLCLPCLLTVAKTATSLGEPPAEKQEGIDVAVNKQETFHDRHVTVGEGIAAVTGKANSSVNLINCHVDGSISKSGNGNVNLNNCLVRADCALDIGGNNNVKMRNCVIIGDVTAVNLTGNAKMEAHDSFFIGVGPQSVAIRLGGNGKADLANCVVTGADGVLATALGNVLARGGSISGQAGPLMNLFTNRVAIAGKHELRETTVVGAKKERAGGPGNLDKLTKKVQSKGISKAKHAI